MYEILIVNTVCRIIMNDIKDNEAYEEELIDYEEEDEKALDSVNAKPNGESVKKLVSFFI